VTSRARGGVRIKTATSISRPITIWLLGPVGQPEKLQVGLVHRPPAACARLRSRQEISLAARRGASLIGRSVVDTEGVELGYVVSEEPQHLVVGEGPVGKLRLGRRFVESVAERVILRGPAVELFAGLNVVDAQGEFVGIVRDTVETEDVLDSFIVEDEQGEMVTVVLEDVRSIDEWLELDVTSDSLYEG